MVGVVFFILGVVVIPILCVLPIILEKSNEVSFKVPGTQTVKIEQPGRYYLWNDFRTVFDGKSYNRSKAIPDGMEIKIRNADGTLLPFISDTSTSSTSNGSAKNSIGYVEIKNSGELKVTISGGDEARIFSFGPSNLLKIFALIFGGIGLSLFVTMIGMGLSIWGIIKLVRSSKTGGAVR